MNNEFTKEELIQAIIHHAELVDKKNRQINSLKEKIGKLKKRNKRLRILAFNISQRLYS